MPRSLQHRRLGTNTANTHPCEIYASMRIRGIGRTGAPEVSDAVRVQATSFQPYSSRASCGERGMEVPADFGPRSRYRFSRQMDALLSKSASFGHYIAQMSADTSSVMNRHLLLQFGDRLRALRKARGMTAEQLASAAGITRTTLRAVESGDPSPAMGTYLRVMAALGISGELALLAGDTLSPAPPGSAAARSRRRPPAVRIEIATSGSAHREQDLRSMALHEEAVRLIKRHPQLVDQAKSVLARWITEQPGSRSMSLWCEWEAILADRRWRKVLSSTAHAQQLRQASPLVVLVPEESRQKIIGQVVALREGVVLTGPADLVSELQGDLPVQPGS